MIEVDVYKQDGSKKGKVSLSNSIFSLPWNDGLVHQAVVNIESSIRSGTAHTKDRSEVRGGGAKPWKQKGTGRARHGSRRSPIWVGGGITFGPRKEKNYTTSINKKMRTKAFFTSLSQKLRDEKVSFVDDILLDNPSTKSAVALVKKICDTSSKNVCTVVFAESNPIAQKSFSNIPGVRTSALDAFNTRDVLIARQIIFVSPEETISKLEARGVNVKSYVDGKEIKSEEKSTLKKSENK